MRSACGFCENLAQLRADRRVFRHDPLVGNASVSRGSLLLPQTASRIPQAGMGYDVDEASREIPNCLSNCQREVSS
jgi:hypothetical protein